MTTKAKTTKNKGGRPTKKTADNVSKLLQALRNGLHRHSACAVTGISRQTMYDWIEKDPSILTQIEDSEEYRLGLVEQAKTKKIEEGYRPAIEKELKSKRRDIYGDHHTLASDKDSPIFESIEVTIRK